MVPQMPACADSNTADVIRDIFKKKDVAPTQLSDLELDTETKSERNCLAHIETEGETGTIAYRITMQGKEFQVMIKGRRQAAVGGRRPNYRLSSPSSPSTATNSARSRARASRKAAPVATCGDQLRRLRSSAQHGCLVAARITSSRI